MSNGRTIGGIPFGRGSLAAFLRNRFYIGEVRYKNEVFPGEQPAILDRALFEAVQTKFDQQRTNYARVRQQSQSPLIGRIFDDRGNRMTPTYALKKGIRYCYYISAPLLQGQTDQAAKLNRVPAAEIEQVILGAVRKHLAESPYNKLEAEGPHSLNDKQLISACVARVDVKRDHLAIQLGTGPAPRNAIPARRAATFLISWKKKPPKLPREIIAPTSTASRADLRPIRTETRAKLITAIAKGRCWLDELIAGTVTNVEQIAKRETCSVRQVNRTITLAVLAPTLVQAAVDGRLPRGIGVATLRDFPAEWTRQYERLGLAP